MTAIVSEKPGAEFLSNKEYLTKYNGTSKSKHHEVPRHAYFNKAQAFFESHYDKGELHMEFLKGDCLQKDGELCDTCSSAENEWIGPATKCTPRTYPDPTHSSKLQKLKFKLT